MIDTFLHTRMIEVMDTLTRVLITIGLTSTEAAIYLSGLGQDSIGVQEIGKKTDIKRPTIYHALRTLIEKGLVAEKKIGNKVSFSMCAPEQLQSYIERQKEKLILQEKSIATIIPLLNQHYRNTEKTSLNIVEYTGIEGIKMVIDIALYCKSKRWDIIAPVHNVLREYDPEYASFYLRARKHNRIVARSLWEQKIDGRKLTKEEIQLRNPRYMPRHMQGRFQSMIFLFDHKVAIISSLKSLSATLISSEEISNMFKALFDGIWEISEEYK